MAATAKKLAAGAQPDAKPDHVARVSVGLLWPFMRALRERSIELGPLLSYAGLTRAEVDDRESRPRHDVIDSFVVAAQERSGDPAIGLWAGSQACASDLGVVGYLFTSAPTLAAALRVYVDYGALLHDGARWSLQTHDDTVRFALTTALPCEPALTEALLTTVTTHLRQVSGDSWNPVEVALAHMPGWRLGDGEDLVGAPITRTGEGSYLAFDAPTLDLPNRQADPVLHQMLRARADEQLAQTGHATSVSQRVRDAILSELPGSCPSRARVARTLHMSPATLGRRLAGEGTSYSDLLDELRCDLALDYLAIPSVSAAEVSARLGFGHVQSFYNAFKRWTGGLPGQHRAGPAPARVMRALNQVSTPTTESTSELNAVDAPTLLERAYLRLRMGDDAGGIVLATTLVDRVDELSTRAETMVAVFELALAACDRGSGTTRQWIDLSLALIHCADLFDPSLLRHAERVLSRLKIDSGLAYALAASEDGAIDRTDLARAAAQAREIHAGTPALEQGLDPEASLQAYVEALATTGHVALSGINLSRLGWVGDQLAALAPAHREARNVEGVMRWLLRANRGLRPLESTAEAMQVAQTMMRADRLVTPTRRAHLLYTGGLVSCWSQTHAARQVADYIEQVAPRWRASAWQIRMLSHLVDGNLAQAEQCRATGQRVAVESGGNWMGDIWPHVQLARYYEMIGSAEDLIPLIARLSTLTRSAPAFTPYVLLARATERRLRGDPREAHAILEGAAQLAPPGEHTAWPGIVAERLLILLALGEFAAVQEHAARALDVAREKNAMLLGSDFRPAVATADAHLGRGDAAAQSLDKLIARADERQLPNVLRASLHAQRSEIARILGDRVGDARHGKRARGLHPAFT